MDTSGHCAIRGHCGSRTGWGKSLPCPYDGTPQELEDDAARKLLVDVCGAQFSEGPVCCTQDQIATLRDNFDTVEALLASCPACRNNFRSFFCSFTCSPDQGSFLNVTSTQLSHDKKVAVKSLDFFVGERFANGFYDSCKEVKLGAANMYAMELIGGGAKDARAFLKYLGDEKEDIGSPFQIDFSYSEPSAEFERYDPTPRSCSDSDLQSRCTCIDCSNVCPALPPVDPPHSGSYCHVGKISCLTFALTNIYGIIVIACFLAYALKLALQVRTDKKIDRLALPGEDPTDNPLSPRSHTRSLLGASSLPHGAEESYGGQSGILRNLGRGASLLDPIETLQPRQYRLNTFLRRSFYRLGFLCATSPWLTFAMVFAAFGLLNIGWKNFEVETDPVRLWVAPDSESRLQKEFFDQHFGPFYRPQQIFITSAPISASRRSIHDSNTSLVTSALEDDLPPVLSYEHLKWWFNIESNIRSLVSSEGYKLSDICFAPSGPKTPCVVQSITAWFEYEIDGYEGLWKDRIMNCASAPAECLPDFKQPLGPEFVLGGLPNGRNVTAAEEYLEARAMVVTIVVENSLDIKKQYIAMDWERSLREYLQHISDVAPHEAGLNVHFSTGVSLEEELNKSTNTDVKIVVLSYLMMFFYVALTLGNNSSEPSEEGFLASLGRWAFTFPRYIRNKLPTSSISLEVDDVPSLLPRLPRGIFVNSKFSLGLFGIGLVILSVSSSFGLFSAVGVKVTLIIAEVIPFLVLAVGVDNVFILVHELDRQNSLHGPNASANPQNSGLASATNAVAQIRPSPFSSSHDDSIDAVSVPIHFTAEERVARALAKMGPSIILSSITETTAFALGALVPMPAVRNFALYAAGSVFLNAVLQVTVFVSALALDLHRIEASRVDCFPCIRLPPRIALLEGRPPGASSGSLTKFIRRNYAPFLLKPVVKGIVLLLFGGIFICSVISIQHIQLGLDQRLALPSDSYLVPYFDALDNYLDVGPPVYFVASGVNVSTRIDQRHLCGKFTTCDDFSVANVLEGERGRSESSFISQPAASWIDDYLHWLDPANGCCRIRRAKPDVFCRSRDSARLCRSCLEGREPGWNITMDGLPEGGEFMWYLRQWIQSPADETCALGGQAAYSTALSFDSKDGLSASHFRTSHSPLKTQADFINSLSAAQRIADYITEHTGVSVFPYSIHYVFFDQYLHIIAITQEILGLGLAAVLVITSLLLGSWRTGSIVTGVVALTVTTVMGVMGVWGISLNALSLVNLVISLGIAVEFCAHIARAFMGTGTGLPVDIYSRQKERDERMWTALVDVGPSVLSGITFTKLIGICVLALTRSKLLEIYYFRMWLTLIISGALHGLVLLPVVLSYAGGPGYSLEDADEEWMSSTIRRYEYTPFLADDESEHSE